MADVPISLTSLTGNVNSLGSVVDFAKSMSPPIARASLYGWNSLLPNQVPTSDELFRLVNREDMSIPWMQEQMLKLGFDKTLSLQMYSASHVKLNIMDYVVLYRRGKITFDLLLKYAQHVGFVIAEVQHLLDVTEYFPSPQDLISFAIRDVYSPETVEEYKLFEDIPQKFLTEALKTGLTEEMAKLYWGSHWQFPTPQQIFQFLQRRVKKPDGKVFQLEDVRLYLKVADYSPQWRDMMTEISYHPITRVDARRMYSFGVLDREGLKDVFQNEGYNEHDAELLTKFTIVHDDPDTTGMTRGNLMSAYVDGCITYKDLTRLMAEIGIIGYALEYWLEIAQYNKVQAEVKKIITRYTAAYLTGSSDLDTIRGKLHQADLPAVYVDKILEDMLYDKLSQRKVPPVETLVRWLESQSITDKDFQGRMRLLNYSDEDILIYLTEVRRKVDTTRKIYLKIADYAGWLKTNVITEQYFRDTLKEMGIGQRDIDFEIVNARREVNEAT
jgi:hypothetical protein